MKFETGDNHYNKCHYVSRPVGCGFDSRSCLSIFHWQSFRTHCVPEVDSGMKAAGA